MKTQELENLARRIKLEVKLDSAEIKELERFLNKFIKLKLKRVKPLKRIVDIPLKLEDLDKLSKNYFSNSIDQKIFHHNALVSKQNLVIIKKNLNK